MYQPSCTYSPCQGSPDPVGPFPTAAGSDLVDLLSFPPSPSGLLCPSSLSGAAPQSLCLGRFCFWISFWPHSPLYNSL
uniref:Uncharacterized protein n=1 Tax=Xenopus tropicalis TaxID=8364 RepID=A0A1B8Y587_XENTR